MPKHAVAISVAVVVVLLIVLAYVWWREDAAILIISDVSLPTTPMSGITTFNFTSGKTTLTAAQLLKSKVCIMSPPSEGKPMLRMKITAATIAPLAKVPSLISGTITADLYGSAMGLVFGGPSGPLFGTHAVVFW